MADNDHKVEIWTTSGETTTAWVSKEDSAYFDDLPFDSATVSRTRVTPPAAT